MERTTKRTLSKSAEMAVRAQKGFAECVAYAAARAAEVDVTPTETPPNTGQFSRLHLQQELLSSSGASPVLELPGPRSRGDTDFFMHSADSIRVDFDARRIGSWQDAVRDVSYAEAMAKLDEQGLQGKAWLHEVRRIIVQAYVIMAALPREHAPVVGALQEALMAMLAEADSDDADEEPPLPSLPTESRTPMSWLSRFFGNANRLRNATAKPRDLCLQNA